MADLFETFCKTVNDTIFSEENKGDIVAFIIDNMFMDDFYKANNTNEFIFMRIAKQHLNVSSYGSSRHHNHLHIKGILAIQLYAATKREDSGGITEANYRERLSQVLNWDLADLQSWMKINQDYYWQELYNWCDKNNFLIAKCRQKIGKGRYVQYPIQQAERIFTQKDLKAIAYHFVEKKLQPGEDIQETDFWKILHKRNLESYIHTNHAKRLLSIPDALEDAYKQIFNFYLKWDGTYLDYIKNKKEQVKQKQFFLFLSDDGFLDVRDESLRIHKRFEWDNLQINSISKYYSYKRDNIIIFKRNEDYEGTWEETRYIEGKDEEGIAIVFKKTRVPSPRTYGRPLFLEPTFTSEKLIFRNNYLTIYRFKYNINLASMFTQKRFFSLLGGLKVGRMRYLQGGSPILHVEKDSQFWIDGNASRDKIQNGKLLLDFLSPGKHFIKFPGFRKIEFSIVKAEKLKHSWEKNYMSWQLKKNPTEWKPSLDGKGIVGIDFSCIKMSGTNQPILTQWANFHAGIISPNNNEDNIALKILTK